MSPPIGDNFPEKQRNAYVKRYIREGSVFRLNFENTTPPKIKRFIILGTDGDSDSAGFLFINKQINIHIFPTSDLQKLHLFLKKTEDRSYLDRDSYIDCSWLYERKLQKLRNEFISNLEIYLGQVSDSDMKKIKQLVISAKTIPPNMKNRYSLL